VSKFNVTFSKVVAIKARQIDLCDAEAGV